MTVIKEQYEIVQGIGKLLLSIENLLEATQLCMLELGVLIQKTNIYALVIEIEEALCELNNNIIYRSIERQ